MSRKKTLVVIIGLGLFIYIFFSKYEYYTDKNMLVPLSCESISGMWIGENIKIENKRDIDIIVDYINTMDKSRNFFHNKTNESPDSILVFKYQNGNELQILFYGNYMFYDNIQYKINFEKISNDLFKSHLTKVTK